MFSPPKNIIKSSFTSNAHISETYKNRAHTDITFFIQNGFPNHLLKLRHKIMGYLYTLNHSKEGMYLTDGVLHKEMAV